MVTLWLFIVGVISLKLFPPEVTAYIYNEPSLIWRFVSLFTHMVSHGSWGHLLGNFIFGAPYMLYLEARIKSAKKFTRLFFLFGFSAWLMQIAFDHFSLFESRGLIGSSGAIFGIVGATLMCYRGPWFLELAARGLLIFHVVTQAQAAWFALSWPMGVASGAHLGGLLAGILFSHLYLNRGPSRFQKLLRDLRRSLLKR